MTLSAAVRLNAKLPYASSAEVAWLTAYAAEHPDAQVVILGGGPGIMTLALLDARIPLRLTIIEQDATVLGTWRAHLQEAGFGAEAVTIIHGDTVQTGAAWDNGEVDLVVVDGDHSRRGVALDLAVWAPQVRVGGLLFLHDYYRPGAEWEGIAQAVTDWLAENRARWQWVEDVDSAFIVQRLW